MKHITSLVLLVICKAFLVSAAPAMADEQDHEQVYQAVHKLTGPNVEIQKVDSRLRLKACQGTITARYPFSRYSTVEVRCMDKNGWKIYLSVSGVVQPQLDDDPVERPNAEPHRSLEPQFRQTEAVVARTLLPRGVPIKASDLVIQAFPIHRIRPSNFSSTEEIIGFEPIQTITAGTLLSLNMLAPPYLVKKGDAVTLVYQRGGIQVSNEALALESGVLNKKIDVQIPETGKVVSAIVTEAGVVTVQ